jgi:hypothetical protein
MLKAIGFWIEKLGDEEFPAPQELVGPMPNSARVQLTKYLDAGLTFRTYRGCSWCRFGCGIPYSQIGDRDLTDGLWLWPEGLSHYGRNHEVILPEEFVRDAFAGATPRQPDENEAVDFSFWVQWCAIRRSPRLLELLRSALPAAEASAAEARRKHLESVIRDRGLSETQCQWIGRTQRALASTVICAEHSLSPNDNARFKAVALFAGLQEHLRAFRV